MDMTITKEQAEFIFKSLLGIKYMELMPLTEAMESLYKKMKSNFPKFQKIESSLIDGITAQPEIYESIKNEFQGARDQINGKYPPKIKLNTKNIAPFVEHHIKFRPEINPN